jgi:hypothetical protein
MFGSYATVPGFEVGHKFVKGPRPARFDISQTFPKRLNRFLSLAPEGQRLLGRHSGRAIGTELLADKAVKIFECTCFRSAQGRSQWRSAVNQINRTTPRKGCQKPVSTLDLRPSLSPLLRVSISPLPRPLGEGRDEGVLSSITLQK